MKPYIGCVIQARLSSTRLPRKHLLEISGITLLEHLVRRVHTAKSIDKLVIACPHSPESCLNEEIFIGSENDVLDRYYQVAKKYNFDYVVRLTADCPFISPYEINRVVEYCIKNNLDYVTNISIDKRFGTPDGWDVECMSFKALEYAWLKATEAYDREHVTSFIKHNVSLKVEYLKPLKLSIDTIEDYNVVKEFYKLESVNYPQPISETEWTWIQKVS
jgi:spore coat polysaccharide biosynthesis protein SpsF (cytidylyltransferase family)